MGNIFFWISEAEVELEERLKRTIEKNNFLNKIKNTMEIIESTLEYLKSTHREHAQSEEDDFCDCPRSVNAFRGYPDYTRECNC